MEQKLKQSKLLALCNPQNPTGRIWTKQELSRIVTICKENNVYIFSDEILCDLCKEREVFHTLVN